MDQPGQVFVQQNSFKRREVVVQRIQGDGIQVEAELKRCRPDAGQTAGERDRAQGVAIGKRVGPNADGALGKSNRGQVLAKEEGVVPQTDHAVGDTDTREWAVGEPVIRDVGYRARDGDTR